MSLHLVITSMPEGEAPVWVREKWIGMSIPLAPWQKSAPTKTLGAGVVTGPRGFFGVLLAKLTGRLDKVEGYCVMSAQAVNLLAQKDPAAADWWQETVPELLGPGQYFIFDSACGHVTDMKQ